MHRIEIIKARSDIVTSWLSLIGILSAIVFGITEYSSSAQRSLDDKKKTTIEFIRKFNERELYETRMVASKIFATMTKRAHDSVQNLRNIEAAQEAAKKFLYENVLSEIETSASGLEITLYVQFFDQVWSCIELDLCDRPSAVRFFHDDAYEALYILAGYIQRKRQTKPQFGTGLERLANLSS